MNNGNTDYNNKNNNNYVRAVSEFHKRTITMTTIKNDITIDSLYEAYYSCRQNKGRTTTASRFEDSYETNLAQLHCDIIMRRYEPSRSVAFIVTKPVNREIFAASFRDRIVHHWICARIEPLLERIFISETFNCRKGKGNSAAIECVRRHIRECSRNYTSDCWIMKIDLQSFFMSINRQMLCNKLCAFVRWNYRGDDVDTLIYLIQKILLNAPEENCLIKGCQEEWLRLAPGKSLFTNGCGFGLPIGNLTSQLTANFLLNDADHFIRDTLGLRMARYVDDICMVGDDKAYLLECVPRIREILYESAGATVHPRKFYLQHYTKGVKFIGAVVKRDRAYISNRTISNAYKSIHYYNSQAGDQRWVRRNAECFVASMNSYLGIMKHYDTYAVRRRLISRIAPEWLSVVDIGPHYLKLIVKKRYRHRERIKYALRQQKRKHSSNRVM